jgi:hypothetical protein
MLYSGTPSRHFKCTDVMMDSGANVSVCSPELVRLLCLQVYKCYTALRIEFENGTITYSDTYVYLGPFLGSTYVMESCTSVTASIPQANSNGYNILLSYKMICYIFDQHEQKICSTQINKGDRLYYMNIEKLYYRYLRVLEVIDLFHL